MRRERPHSLLFGESDAPRMDRRSIGEFVLVSLLSRFSAFLHVASFACLIVAAVGCETQVPATFPTAAEHSDDERRPDGIAVDLTSEPPGPKALGHTEDKILTLETPLGVDVALSTVRGFFDSLETEDISTMLQFVESGAMLHDTSPRTNRPVHNVTALWRQRFRKHEYHLLATRLVYREGDITTYRGDQLEMLPISVRYLTPPVHTEPTDIVLRVPIVTHRIKSRRVFGDELFFWLRRVDDKLTIYRVAEDVPL